MTTTRPVAGSTEYASMRRKQWRCVWGLLSLLAVLLAATGYVCLFRSVPLRICKETTYITGPLKSDGKQVDYFAAWEQETYSEDIATEENGYRLIVQHLGKPPEMTSELFTQLCKKLGLDAATITPDMTFEEPDDFLREYVESQIVDDELIARLENERRSQEAGPIDLAHVSELDTFDVRKLLQVRVTRPWSNDDLPMMQPWLVKNAPALDLIDAAVQKPTFHVPMLRDSEGEPLWKMGRYEFCEMRDFAKALSVRANHRIATGEIDEAIDDIGTCRRLGRHIEREGSLNSSLISIRIDGIADAVGIAGALDHPPTKDQLRRLVEIRNDGPPDAEFRDTLRFDRYQMLSLVQSVAGGTAPLFELMLCIEEPAKLGYDWNVIARRMNEQFNAMETTGQFLSPSAGPMAMVFVGSRSEVLTDKIADFLLPVYATSRATLQRRTCRARIHRITLAMLLYECDHGTLPPAYTIDGSGNPLHSWRVVLLPHLEQQELCDKIRLDEPWDSQHNRQFHDEAVPFYECPSAELSPGQTTYSVVVGPDVPFDAAEARTLSSFGPRSANMILVVERKQDVCWMNPTQEVLQVHAEEGVNPRGLDPVGIGGQHTGGANVGLRSGAVRFISFMVDKELFGELLRGESDKAL